jgi:hypothetical protein
MLVNEGQSQWCYGLWAAALACQENDVLLYELSCPVELRQSLPALGGYPSTCPRGIPLYCDSVGVDGLIAKVG